MKHLIIYMLCAFCLPLSAQRITRQYHNVSMADALKELVRLKDLKEVDPAAHDAGKEDAWAAARAAVRRLEVES